jgi:hypothetical protein
METNPIIEKFLVLLHLASDGYANPKGFKENFKNKGYKLFRDNLCVRIAVYQLLVKNTHDYSTYRCVNNNPVIQQLGSVYDGVIPDLTVGYCKESYKSLDLLLDLLRDITISQETSDRYVAQFIQECTLANASALTNESVALKSRKYNRFIAKELYQKHYSVRVFTEMLLVNWKADENETFRRVLVSLRMSDEQIISLFMLYANSLTRCDLFSYWRNKLKLLNIVDDLYRHDFVQKKVTEVIAKGGSKKNREMFIKNLCEIKERRERCSSKS